MYNTKVLTRESNWHKRKVNEAIYIKQESPYHEQRPPSRHLQSNYPTKTRAISCDTSS